MKLAPLPSLPSSFGRSRGTIESTRRIHALPHGSSILRLTPSLGQRSSIGRVRRPDREKERCSGSFHLAVRFLVIKDDSISYSCRFSSNNRSIVSVSTLQELELTKRMQEPVQHFQQLFSQPPCGRFIILCGSQKMYQPDLTNGFSFGVVVSLALLRVNADRLSSSRRLRAVIMDEPTWRCRQNNY